MRVVRGLTVQSGVLQRNTILTTSLGVAGALLVSLFLFGVVSGFLGFVLFILSIGMFGACFWFALQVYQERLERHQQAHLVTLLSSFLDNGFIYFENLTLHENRSIGTVDGVLLGPHGAIVLELANFSGDYICEGDTWYKYVGGHKTIPSENVDLYRKRLKDSPTWHVIRSAREVKAWLSVRSLPQVPVQPLVLLTRGKLHSIKRPSVPIVELGQLETYLKNNLFEKPVISSEEQISEGMLEQIAERLKS